MCTYSYQLKLIEFITLFIGISLLIYSFTLYLNEINNIGEN